MRCAPPPHPLQQGVGEGGGEGAGCRGQGLEGKGVARERLPSLFLFSFFRGGGGGGAEKSEEHKGDTRTFSGRP